ncbi:MAG: carbohydrate-binding family 9-like protein [Candidatus Marinimicrobia bacterium]|nr:carbohydrate-binding family 9-like protein [Candidatus Neomarinimicrobiota bacterium]
MARNYHIYYNKNMENISLDWSSPLWQKAQIARIDNFHPQSSDHRPETLVKIQYNPKGIFVIFKVKDQFVRTHYTDYNANVHEDSCVEWFIRPPQAEGYYNFEVNASGTLHVNYIVDPERDAKGERKDMRSIPEQHAKQIEILSSLPRVVDPEIKEKIIWFLALNIPFTFFEYFTPLKKINSSIWQGNLYKCGDKTSHPHWAAWSPIEKLNFHQPIHYGEFTFSEVTG